MPRRSSSCSAEHSCRRRGRRTAWSPPPACCIPASSLQPLQSELAAHSVRVVPVPVLVWLPASMPMWLPVTPCAAAYSLVGGSASFALCHACVPMQRRGWQAGGCRAGHGGITRRCWHARRPWAGTAHLVQRSANLGGVSMRLASGGCTRVEQAGGHARRLQVIRRQRPCDGPAHAPCKPPCALVPATAAPPAAPLTLHDVRLGGAAGVRLCMLGCAWHVALRPCRGDAHVCAAPYILSGVGWVGIGLGACSAAGSGSGRGVEKPASRARDSGADQGPHQPPPLPAAPGCAAACSPVPGMCLRMAGAEAWGAQLLDGFLGRKVSGTWSGGSGGACG